MGEYHGLPSGVNCGRRTPEEGAPAWTSTAARGLPHRATLVRMGQGLANGSAANAPHSNVSRYERPQQSIRSPALAFSGSVTTLSQSGQLTRCAMVPTHPFPSCLTQSALPAQFGHSTRSPDFVPGGSGITIPQSGHRTSAMPSDTAEPLETATVEADYYLIVNDDHRDGHPPGARDQLVARCRILCDVLGSEVEAMRRKELFRRVTGLSGRGPIDRDLMRHLQPSKSRPPKTHSPILKPSATVVPAPSAVGFASRHLLRCSSDRKKLIVVQRESKALHCSSTRLPNHSMMPLASGSGPCGVAENVRGALQ